MVIRLTRSLAVLIVVLSGAFFTFPAAAGAATIYVSPSGNDTTGLGTFAAPYKSLTKGMQVSVSGDTVQADYGTYSSATTEAGYDFPFPIMLKAGVTLRGMGFDQSTILGDTNGNFVVSADTADGARLEGFTVTGSINGAGIGVQNNVSMLAPVMISRNRVTGNSGPFGAGINVANGGSAAITNNIVDNNTASMSGGGICVDVGGAATIANNTIAANTLQLVSEPPPLLPPPASGVSSSSAASSVVNCIIYGNTTFSFYVGPPAENYDYTSPVGAPNPLLYCIYGASNTAPGPGCQNVNPQFDPATTYNVLGTSTAIDLGATPGSYSAVPTVDINETPRPIIIIPGDGYDIGAYEWGDFIAPTGSIEINGGAASTNSAIVNLAMPATDTSGYTGASGLGRMRLSNNGTTWTPWWWYAATYTGWNLTSGYGGAPGGGNKTVYIQIEDRAGNVQSTTYSDAILLVSPTGTVSIDGPTYLGTKFAAANPVNLNVTGNDPATGGNPAEMCFSNDGVTWSDYVPFGAIKTGWSLTSNDGLKTVYVKVRNTNGVESSNPQASDTVILDTTWPTGLSLLINAGDASTTSKFVTLTPGATDADAYGVCLMRFSNNGTSWRSWEAYGTTGTGWDITDAAYGGTSEPGNKTVYVQFRDPAGHESSTAGSILLIDLPPTNQGYIISLYRTLLQRAGTPWTADMQPWLDALNNGALSREGVAYAMMTSHEYHMRMVREMYQVVLGRSAEVYEQHLWANAMDAGLSLRWMRASVYGSGEFATRYPTSISYVNFLYDNILGRNGQYDAGRDAWANAINNGSMYRADVAYLIMCSDEYYTGYITSKYIDILGRAPEPGGLASWLGGMRNGMTEEVLPAQLYGSYEYFVTHANI